MGSFSSTLGSLWVEINARVDDAISAFGQIETEVDKVEEKFSGMEKIGQQMAGLGAGLTAGITVPLTGLAALAIDAAGDMDSLMRGLTAVAGSSTEAATQMERLKEVAKLPGLGLEEAVQGSIRLQAVGVSAKDAESYMMAFGNALETVGKGRADLEGVLTQLVQMSSKTKVVAEDLKPIMERVPQVASILKEAYGTIDTEALQKAGLTTQEVINTIISGLQKLPPVTGGIKNAMENLKDSASQSLVAIGNALIPVIEKITPMIESFLAGVKSLAEWFTNLPGPAQAAIGTLVALTAALGPVLLAIGGITTAIAAAMPALTALGGFFGVSVAALAPWAAGIAAVLAALVALGVWVNENWEPITAVLKQAWEGVQENWTAVWTAISTALTGAWNTISGAVATVWEPIGKFFSEIWQHIEPYFSAVWNGIKDSLTGVWNAIKSAASTVWDGIVGVFQTFLEWAAKIPGANKLINLDEAWKSAQNLKTHMDAAGTATDKFAGKAKSAAGTPTAPVPKLGKAIADTGKASKEAGEKMQPLETATGDLQTAATNAEPPARKLGQAWKDAAQYVEDLKNGLVPAKDQIVQMIQPTDDLVTQVEDLNTAMQDWTKITGPQFLAQLTAIDGGTADYEQGLKDLGITSATEYANVARDAKTAYDAVLQSPMASQWEKDNALVRVLEAQKQAAIAAGTEVPAEVEKELAAVKAKLEDPTKGVPAMKKPWEDFGTQVSTIVTNFAQDIGKSLFDGDLSWGEKMKGMLKSVGEAVMSTFVTPAVNALTGLMEGVLKDLMSGDKGFSGLKDSIKGVGEIFKGIFGKGGSIEQDAKNAGDAVSGIGGGAGQAAGGAGGAGGAAGSAASAGLTGWISAISGAVTAISSVIGNFQMAGMNKTLDLIERYTRFSEIHLKHILEDDLNKYLPVLDAINGYLWEHFNPAFAELMDIMRDDVGAACKKTNDQLKDWLQPLHDETIYKWKSYEDRLYEIADATWWTKEHLDVIRNDVATMKGYLETTRNSTTAMKDKMTGAQTWTVQFTGDPIARLVGDEIMRQLRMQGINLV